MYIPIAALYNDDGLLTHIRFFQWCTDGSYLMNMDKDKYYNFSERYFNEYYDVRERGFNPIIRARVIELGYTEAFKLECFSEQSAWLRFTLGQFLTLERSDGSVLEDAVSIVSETKEEFCVVDGKGRSALFDKGDLAFLVRKAGLKLNDVFEYNKSVYPMQNDSLIPLKKQSVVNDLVEHCSLFGIDCSIEMGKLKIILPKNMILPNEVGSVVVRIESEVTELVVPDRCSVACFGSRLRRLVAPDCCESFVVKCGEGLEQFSIPRVMMKHPLMGCQFSLTAERLPNDFKTLDQSKYADCVGNSIVVKHNNLESIWLKMMNDPKCASESYLDLAFANYLRELHLVPCSVEYKVRICLSHPSNSLVINYSGYCRWMDISVSKIEKSIVRFKRESTNSRLFELDVSVDLMCPTSRVVIIFEYGTDLTVLGEYGTRRNKKVDNIWDENRLISEFLNGYTYSERVLCIEEHF